MTLMAFARCVLVAATTLVAFVGQAAAADQDKPDKSKTNPAPGKAYQDNIQNKIDDLKPAVDRVNAARDAYKSQYDAAATEASSARGKVSAARANLASAQTGLSAAYGQLRATLKDHPDVKAAETRLRSVREAEDAVRDKLLQPLYKTEKYQTVIRHAAEVEAAMEKARRQPKPNAAFLSSASAKLNAYNAQIGAMQTAALHGDAPYIDAARETRFASEELARAKRKAENEFGKHPKVKEAWDVILAAEKEVRATELEVGAAEKKMSEAESGYRGLQSRAYFLNRDMKELEIRMTQAKSKKK